MSKSKKNAYNEKFTYFDKFIKTILNYMIVVRGGRHDVADQVPEHVDYHVQGD